MNELTNTDNNKLQVSNQSIVKNRTVTSMIPQSLSQVMQYADILSRSQMVPECYQGNPSDIVAALQLGSELGIPPMTMLSNSYPVNNKIAFFTDMLMALVKSHSSYRGMKIMQESENCFEAEAYRDNAGTIETIYVKFTKEDAIKAGIWNSKDVWKKYPQRMLKHRGCSYLAKNGWPDVIAGIYTYDELNADNSAPEMRNVSPNPEEGLEYNMQDNLFKEPDELTELIMLARDAKYTAKAITELKKKFNAVKDNEKVLNLFIEKQKKEIAGKQNQLSKPMIIEASNEDS